LNTFYSNYARLKIHCAKLICSLWQTPDNSVLWLSEALLELTGRTDFAVHSVGDTSCPLAGFNIKLGAVVPGGPVLSEFLLSVPVVKLEIDFSVEFVELELWHRCLRQLFVVVWVVLGHVVPGLGVVVDVLPLVPGVAHAGELVHSFGELFGDDAELAEAGVVAVLDFAGLVELPPHGLGQPLVRIGLVIMRPTPHVEESQEQHLCTTWHRVVVKVLLQVAQFNL